MVIKTSLYEWDTDDLRVSICLCVSKNAIWTIFEPSRRRWPRSPSLAEFLYISGYLGQLATKALVWLYLENNPLDCCRQSVKLICNCSASIGNCLTDVSLLDWLYWRLMVSRISGNWSRPRESENPSDSCTGYFVKNFNILDFPNKWRFNLHVVNRTSLNVKSFAICLEILP